MKQDSYKQKQFDDALVAMLQDSTSSEVNRTRIVARDLHKLVVGGSQPNRMAMACKAMWKLAKKLTHSVIHETPSGHSSSLEIEFHVDTMADMVDSFALPDADLYLVACVKTKHNESSKAKDLYISSWFRKARACVEKTRRPWLILSAKHGLVKPDQAIEPYEQTLNQMSVEQRQQWASDVIESLEPHLKGVSSVVMLASKKYRQLLQANLKRRNIEVLVPMAGLSQGKQLAWLNNCLTRT